MDGGLIRKVLSADPRFALVVVTASSALVIWRQCHPFDEPDGPDDGELLPITNCA